MAMDEKDRDLDQDTTNDHDKTAEFQERVGQVLRESEVDLDVETLDQLAMARRTAVSQADRTTSALQPWAVGLAGSAAAAALVLALTLNTIEEELPPMDEVEFVVAQDAELMEDLEFVAWMIALEENGELESLDDSPVPS